MRLFSRKRTHEWIWRAVWLPLPLYGGRLAAALCTTIRRTRFRLPCHSEERSDVGISWDMLQIRTVYQEIAPQAFPSVTTAFGLAMTAVVGDWSFFRRGGTSRPPCQRGQLLNCRKQFRSGGFSGRAVRIRPTLRRIRRNALRIPPTSLLLGHLPLTREAWVLPHQ